MAKSRKTEVDTDWFKAKIEALGFSQREVALKMGIDASGFHGLLHGTRGIEAAEAARLASILGVGLDVVLMHIGLPESLLGFDRGASARVPVVGWLDGTLTLRKDGLKGRKDVPYPFRDVDRQVRCARVQTAGTEFAGMDGALYFYREAKGQTGVDSTALGKLALVRIRGERELKLRELRRGYGPEGSYNLAAPSGRVIEESVKVEYATPLIWIKL